MKNPRSAENKIIITLFILVILVFVGMFVGRDYVFNYINSNTTLSQTTSEMFSSATSKDFDVDKEQVLDLKIFENRKFNDLERNTFSLPRFGTGRKNPFQSINQ